MQRRAPTFDRGYSTGALVAVTYGSGSSAGTYRGYDQMGRIVDYFLARYYSSTQGRFTSPDEFNGGPVELFTEAASHKSDFLCRSSTAAKSEQVSVLLQQSVALCRP
ncbi:MAG: hypothetical protein H0U60_04795 [Blastocatellia bacterium]|nr:hypothetical protein [Blastocatellia bacterium]